MQLVVGMFLKTERVGTLKLTNPSSNQPHQEEARLFLTLAISIKGLYCLLKIQDNLALIIVTTKVDKHSYN